MNRDQIEALIMLVYLIVLITLTSLTVVGYQWALVATVFYVGISVTLVIAGVIYKLLRTIFGGDL